MNKFPEPLEKDVQKAVLATLKLHPQVAWVERMNTGCVSHVRSNGSKGFTRFGFVGLSDIIGQLKNGKFLAVEVKRLSGTATRAQLDFIQIVNNHNGVAFIARSVNDVVAMLIDVEES